MYNEYLEKLEKIKAEKIKLGSVDDLKSGRNNAVKEFNKIFEKKKAVFSSLKDAKKQAQKSAKEWSLLAGELVKVEKQAKELGVDLPKDIKKLGKEILESSKISKNQISKIETSEKGLKGF